VLLDGDDPPLVAHQGGQVGGLAAGCGAEVEHRVARRRRQHARDGHRGARLRHEQPFLPQRRGERVERRVEDKALGQAVGRVRGDAEALVQLVGRDPQRVRAQRRLGRLVTGSHQRAGGIRAKGAEPQLGDPQRVRMAQRRVGGRGVRQRLDERTRLARGAPQHRVDQRGAPARGRFRQLDRLANRGVGRHAVEEDELEDAEAQRREHRRLEL
jgi:hypothetical protein